MSKALSAFEQAELQQQVLELSSQVEVMREALIELRSDFGMLPSHPCGPQMYNSIGDAINKVLSITPSAALASHDNEVAAKALEEAAAQLASGLSARHLLSMATEWRNRK